MKAKLLLKTGVFCLAAFGCIDLRSPASGPIVGVSTAEARDYYTRKKINGKWVTGVFPKRAAKSEAQTVARAAAPEPVPEPPQPQPQPTLFGLNIPGIDLTYRPPMGSQAAQQQAAQAQAQAQPQQQAAPVDENTLDRAAYTGTRSGQKNGLISGTPGVQDKGAEAAAESRESKRSRVVRSAEPKRERVAERRSRPSAAERRRAEEEFAAAVAQPNQPAEPVLPSAAQAYAPAPEATDLMTALQRKARALAAEEAGVTGSIAAPARAAYASAKPIRTVTIDYENNIKTTIFQDGTIEEEAVAR